MSGFVCIANLDGAPIDPALMSRMTNALAFRGPDAEEIWIGDEVGFGHAMFRTTDESMRERQPCSLDGEVWITGDVRVDGRAELVRALQMAGRSELGTATDPELILHAYHAWGEALVDHLLGDFAFAIWDGPKRRLLCARDQLGVKPFFYAQLQRRLLLSNTLSCLRDHGSLPDELNDDAVGDFLLFGYNRDPKTTTYAAIQRLPGGHMLTWSPGRGPRVRRYWTLPVHDELRLTRPNDYVERFRSLLRLATTDRLRTDRVGVLMSGGLDSSLIAATAHGLLAGRGAPFEVRAHTVVYDRLIKDEERHYSGLVARSLNIPIEYLVADDYPLFDGYDGHDGPRVEFPEPVAGYEQPILIDAFNRQVAAGSRVALTGFDGDAVLTASWSAHLGTLWRNGQFGRLAADAFRYALAKQDLIGAFSRRLRWPRRGGGALSDYPTWFNPAFERRLQLQDRWARSQAQASKGRGGAREGAYYAMLLSNWLPLLEGSDAGVTGVPLERRHPLLDLRLVGFLLSLPAIPWCVDKHIFRAAAQNVLPKPILRRPKTPLAGDPYPGLLRDYKAQSGNPFAFHPAVGRYVDASQLVNVVDQTETVRYWISLRVLQFSQWLSARRVSSK
ncbi:MAG: asparagine synthetase B family protein [Sphingomicrobium sp.]